MTIFKKIWTQLNLIIVSYDLRDIGAADLCVKHKLFQDYAQQLKVKGVRAVGLLVQEVHS